MANAKLGFFPVIVGLIGFLIAVLFSALSAATYLSIVAVFMYCILTIVGIVPPQPIL